MPFYPSAHVVPSLFRDVLARHSHGSAMLAKFRPMTAHRPAYFDLDPLVLVNVFVVDVHNFSGKRLADAEFG